MTLLNKSLRGGVKTRPFFARTIDERPRIYIQVFSLLLCLVGAALYIELAWAAPFIPKDDSEVLERLRAPGDPQARQLRRLRKALSQDPRNLTLAVELARRYRGIGRAEADPRYYGYAQAALRPWWDQPRPPPQVLVLRATLRQARHDFDGALEDLSQVLEAQPDNAQAWLTRAVILTVRGDHAGARRNCLQLSRLANALVATACLSHAGSLSGEAEKSYQLLKRSVAKSLSADPQVRLWALTILAEIAVRLNRDQAAEEHFQAALSLGLRNTYLLGAYADFLLDQNRPGEVEALLDDDIRPDDLLLRLALAEQRLDSLQLSNHLNSLRARFAANRLRGDTLHLRNAARFTLYLLNDPAQALQLAQKNWALQREPWDARLLLEAALKADDPDAARPVLNWLATSQLEDVQIQRLVEQIKSFRQ